MTLLLKVDALLFICSYKIDGSLCMKERILILKYARENPNLIINSNSKFCSTYRHKPKFHSYTATPHPSTEDKQ